jgi:hypothetical protein
MSALFSTLPASSSVRGVVASHSWSQSLVLRVVLLAGSVAAGLVGSALANPVVGVEPELVFLMRGMALIKASLALASIALAYWRFGQPVPYRVAVGYSFGVWLLVAATALIWYLSFIPAAAIMFHVGLVALLALPWREGQAGRSARAA